MIRTPARDVRDRLQRLVLVAFLGAVMTQLACAQEPVTVVVDGVGAVMADVGAARDVAIRDALRNAVEQALGVSVESRTLMVDLQVAEDHVVGRAEGFVRSYQMLEESRVDDLYRVTVEAIVDTQVLIDDLEGFGALLRLSLGNPRVLVVVTERDGYNQEPVATRLLTDHFVEREFFVLSAEQLGLISAGETPLSNAEVVNAARTVEADLVLVATVSSTALGTRSTPNNVLATVRATVSAQAILARTGQVIASTTRDSTAVSTYMATAREDAVASATRELLEPFTLDTIRVLNNSLSGVGGTQTHRVTFEGVDDFRIALQLRSALEAIRGVTSLQQRQFGNGSVEFDVQGSATTEDLAVNLISVPDLVIEITYLDSQRLEAEVVTE